MQPFDDTFGAEQVANIIVQRLEDQIPGPLLYELHDVVGELGNNVDEHSGSPVGGFMAAQTYMRGSAEEVIVVAMGDAGIGIREHLQRRHAVASDADAIEKALKRYISGADRQGRGVGLADFVDFVARFGVATIQSGSGSAQIGKVPHTWTNSSHLQGTLIGARLRCRDKGEGRQHR